MKKVMVFGSTGMIGIYLTDELIEKNFSVFAVGNKHINEKYYKDRNIKFASVDISKKDNFHVLPKGDIDVVVLLSAIMPANMKGYEPQKYFDVNTIGTLNVLEYCKDIGVKQIIYTQSHSDVSGHWGKGPINPYAYKSINYNNDHTVYVISKIAGMELVKHYHEAYGISYCIFRCPNIYAYHPDKYYHVNGEAREVGYRKFIEQAINSEPIEIWGDCKTAKDIVYIKDLTQMIIKAIQKEIKHGVYNVSTGAVTSLEEQILGIIDVFSPKDNPSKVIYRPDKNVALNNHQYNIDNAKKELGYEPKYFYKEMLEDMKKEMKSNRFDFLEKAAAI